MTTDPQAENNLLQNRPQLDQSLRARAMEKLQSVLGQFPEKETDLTLDAVRQMLHELQVHQIELQMQNDELRRSQNALEESNARFHDLYNNAVVGYCLIDADGLICDANQTLGEMLGYTQNHLNRQKFTSLIEKEDQDIFYHLRRRNLASVQPQTCIVRMHKSDSSRAWIELSVRSASIDGDAVCLRVALQDVDARVRAEAARDSREIQLRESQKMEAVGTLAGGIAHDFNNILTVILVNAEMVDRLTGADLPKVQPFVHGIQKSAGRARELVKQILTFCRRQPTHRHLVSLADVIEESVSLLQATMPARFRLEFTCDKSVPEVLADDTQIEQVVINMATNAMQAMEGKNGCFRIHLDTVNLQNDAINDRNFDPELWSACDSAVRIVFADDGPGMEPNVVDRIFEPFYTTKPVNLGTGLGLAVVHGIVRAHHGQIFVKTKLGQGTEFTILLPPAGPASVDGSNEEEHDARLVGQAPEKDDSSPREHFDYNILFVDDDSFVLKAIVQLLREYGVLVKGFTDPTAALMFLEETSNEFEILVSDYNMPGLSGLEFARQVHQIRPGLPVVVTSGNIDDDLRANAHEAGVMALMPKPFSASDFLKLLKQVGQAM